MVSSSSGMKSQQSSMAMFCYLVALFFTSGYWNCKAASSFSFENRYLLSSHRNQNYKTLLHRKFQDDEKLFSQSISSLQKRNKIDTSKSSFNRGDLFRCGVASSTNLRGGDIVSFASQDSKASPYSRNSLLMAGGIVLILTELYAHAPFSSIATSPSKFIVNTILSVSFWSAIAPFASLFLKLSPMPTILNLRNQKDVGGLPLLPYSAMCTLTFVLAVYGFLVGDLKIMLTHGTGHLISLFYCYSYLKNCPSTATHLPGSPKLHKIISGSIMSATCLAVILYGKNAAKFAGSSSVFLSSLMYIGPLSVIKSAIKKKSARDIPLPFAINSFMNSLAWSVYGFFKINDWMIYTPCLIGFISSSTQLVLNFIFREEAEKLHAV